MRAAQAVIVKENVSKDRGKQAVDLALAGNWAEAADLNREILQDHPDDVEAHNRLGKSLSELGDVTEAVTAFEQALSLSPHNRIARKNLQRLGGLGRTAQASTTRKGASSTRRAAVTEEAGKYGVVPLVNLGDPDIVSRLTPGDAVELASTDRVIKAVTTDGVRIGQVEPRLGARLSKLMAGGNIYQAAIKDLAEVDMTLLIREIYQHPSQIGVVSFPSMERTGPGQASAGVSASIAFESGGPDMPRIGAIKDWSDDDTEPGDDEVFAAPAVQRIINSSGDPDEEQI